MKPRIGSGSAGRFDQRNTMFSRPRDPERSDPDILDMGHRHYGVRTFRDDEEGYTLRDWAFGIGCRCSPGQFAVMIAAENAFLNFPCGSFVAQVRVIARE